MNNGNVNENRNSTFSRSLFLWGPEFFQFIIAALLIAAFFSLLLLNFPSDEGVAQGIFTGFIAWIGTIIGFYFGQRPVKEISHNLEIQSSKTGVQRRRASEAINTIRILNDKLEAVRKELLGDEYV